MDNVEYENIKGLLNELSIPADIVDEDLMVLWANKAMLELAGGDIAGKKCYESYRDDKKQCPNCPFRSEVANTATIKTSLVFGGKTAKITHAPETYVGKKVIIEVFDDIKPMD